MDEHIISLGMWWAPWGLQFWVFWGFRSPLQFGERSQNFAKPKRFWKGVFFFFFFGGGSIYIYIYVYVYVYVYYVNICIYLCIYVCILILYIRFILMCSIHVGKLGDFLASHVRLESKILNSATSQKFGAKSHRWTHDLRFAKVAISSFFITFLRSSSHFLSIFLKTWKLLTWKSLPLKGKNHLPNLHDFRGFHFRPGIFRGVSCMSRVSFCSRSNRISTYDSLSLNLMGVCVCLSWPQK